MNTPDDFDEAYEGNQSDERYWYWDDSLHTRLAGRIKRMLKGETPEATQEAFEAAPIDCTLEQWEPPPGGYHDDSKERWEADHNGDSYLDFERCAK